MSTAYEFWAYYQHLMQRFWDNLGPQEYAGILIVVGVIGWLLMRSNLKR